MPRALFVPMYLRACECEIEIAKPEKILWVGTKKTKMTKSIYQ